MSLPMRVDVALHGREHDAALVERAPLPAGTSSRASTAAFIASAATISCGRKTSPRPYASPSRWIAGVSTSRDDVAAGALPPRDELVDELGRGVGVTRSIAAAREALGGRPAPRPARRRRPRARRDVRGAGLARDPPSSARVRRSSARRCSSRPSSTSAAATARIDSTSRRVRRWRRRGPRRRPCARNARVERRAAGQAVAHVAHAQDRRQAQVARTRHARPRASPPRRRARVAAVSTRQSTTRSRSVSPAACAASRTRSTIATRPSRRLGDAVVVEREHDDGRAVARRERQHRRERLFAAVHRVHERAAGIEP